MDRSITVNDQILDYVHEFGVREHGVLAKCRAETHATQEYAVMQISPEQGAFLALLIKLMRAKHCLEIGVFTGYSTLNAALALPEDGTVVACELEASYLSIAKTYWDEAGVTGKIDARLGSADKTLRELMNDKSQPAFDFAFIDADKTNYDTYYESALALLRPGGLIAIDNVLWSGDVVNPNDRSADTEAIRAINRKISTDKRVDICLAPFADGIFLCRKC